MENTAIVVTLIICGTVFFIAVISILFAMWVIRQGMEFEKQKKK